MKKVFILRGLPNSGKSTLAKELAGDSGLICEADDYFRNKKGEYNFNPKELPMAHDKCQKLFRGGLEVGQSPIIVSNTSTQEWEFEEYMADAKMHGYMVFVFVVEGRHGQKSSEKSVPGSAIERMRERFEIQL